MAVFDFLKFLLAQDGRESDQYMIGAHRAGGSLDLSSTDDPTKGPVQIGKLTYDEFHHFFGNMPEPLEALHFQGRFRIDNSVDPDQVVFQIDQFSGIPPAGVPIAGMLIQSGGKLYVLPLYNVPTGVAAVPLEASSQTRALGLSWEIAASIGFPGDTFIREHYPESLDDSLSSSGHVWHVERGDWRVAADGVQWQGGGPLAMATLDGQSANGLLSMQMAWPSPATSYQTGLLLRYSPVTQSAWALLQFPTFWLLIDYYSITGLFGSNFYAIPTTPHTGDTLRVTLDGDQIKVEVQPLAGSFTTIFDEEVISLNTTATLHGLAATWTASAGEVRFKSFSFTP